MSYNNVKHLYFIIALYYSQLLCLLNICCCSTIFLCSTAFFLYSYICSLYNFYLILSSLLSTCTHRGYLSDFGSGPNGTLCCLPLLLRFTAALASLLFVIPDGPTTHPFFPILSLSSRCARPLFRADGPTSHPPCFHPQHFCSCAPAAYLPARPPPFFSPNGHTSFSFLAPNTANPNPDLPSVLLLTPSFPSLLCPRTPHRLTCCCCFL